MTSRFVKPVNAMQSGFSYLMSSLARIPVISGMPVSVSAELTNNCNLRCPECASGSEVITRGRGFMNIELYEKLISELSPYLYYINLYFQGEPMMHPQFFSFAALSRNINTVVSTNGHFLSPENSEKLAVSGLKKLIVSLDGMDQKVYSIYRHNGDFGKVVAGIKNVTSAIVRHNSSLNMEIQFLVNRHNEHQIPEAERFAKDVGARLKLKSMQIINSHDAEEWMPAERKFRRYKESDGRYIIKSSLPDRCMRLFFNPVITWDGKIIPCCFDKDAEFVMGDLNNESFKSIWNGKRYNEFRKKILTGRNKIDICRNCTSGMNLKIVR
jgi:radical SAM protein with 4Fe4S-binding SPASM domain